MPKRPRREIPGLKPLPDGRFLVDVLTKDGKRPRHIYDTYREAMRELHKIENADDEDRLEPVNKQKMTFAEAAARSLENKEGKVSSRTHRKNEIMLGIVLKEVPGLGAMRVAQIDEEYIERILRTLSKARELEGSTVNVYRVALSRVFTYLRKKKIIPANPVRDVEKFKESKKRERYLREHEEIVLRRVIREVCPEREPEFDLALHTGIRREEQFWLLWQDVDWGRKVLDIPGEISKTDDHWVPLNSTALAALTKLQTIFTGPRVTRVEDTEDGYHHALDWFHGDRKKIIGVVEIAKIPNFHWHDLRHTFATRLMMKGAALNNVSQYLGHKTIAMTMRYAHFAPDNMHEEVERIVGMGRKTDDKTDDISGSKVIQMHETKKVTKIG